MRRHDEPYLHIAKWNKPFWKGYTPCNSNFVTFWKGKTIETKKISVVSRAHGSGGGWMGRTQRFLGQWAYSVW